MLINRYRIHKWLAITVGVALTVWTVSGLLMILPRPALDAMVPSKKSPVDYSRLVITPAVAAATVTSKSSGEPIEVKQVTLETVRDTTVYRVGLSDGQVRLVDAVTGTPLVISPELAKQIALDRMEPDMGEVSVNLLEERGIRYQYGPLPVYRVEFENGGGTIAYVGAEDGSVRFTNLSRQIWGGLTTFHDFYPLAVVFSEPVKHYTLLIATLSLVLVIVTGYFIALAPRSRRVRKLNRKQ